MNAAEKAWREASNQGTDDQPFHGQRESFEAGYKAAGEEIISEIECCALVLATDSADSGSYLTAAVLQKAADIARTTAGLEAAS